MFIGPVFYREAAVAPRRIRHFLLRGVYGAALLVLICTAWMLLNGTLIVRNVGDMSRFGTILFQVLAPLQLAIVLFFAAIQAASSVTVEKDKQTIILLLMSRLTNSELVLGKLFSSLLNIGVMLMTSGPIFMLIVLFGGTSFDQVVWTYAVTAATALAAGSLGTMIAFWRDKTFQTLALVVLSIVFWVGGAEGIRYWEGTFLGFSGIQISNATHPIRTILTASQPSVTDIGWIAVVPYFLFAVGLASLVCGWAIVCVRKWNPSRDVRPAVSVESASDVDLFTGQIKIDREELPLEHSALTGIKSLNQASKNTVGGRRVWDNPVLWRECCTWAYGRKIVAIRVAYWLITALACLALYNLISSGAATRTTSQDGVRVPVVAQPLVPFMLVSLVMINALAVTSITNERDGRSLDLIRVTDISPREFLEGKLLGVAYVAWDLITLPLILSFFLCYQGLLGLENLTYLVVGWIVMVIFVIVLGLHCGMSYAQSRQAIAVSMGTVFFLFLGVVTVMLMMISFTGNVEAQLAPFVACIVGGAIGLYLALGRNMPSTALALACLLLPISMLYSLTSFVLGNYLSVITVLSFTYGFATTSMVLPRLSEFLITMDHSKIGDDE